MKELSACTSILVGKKASIDGSTMIARNDDTFGPIDPARFIVKEGYQNEPGKTVKSYLNKFETNLPENGYRYSAAPNVDYKNEGYYEESGINEKNVGMSATESTYGNEKTLAIDPLVVDGLDEDCIVNVVLPFINSAREGVEYTGKLIAKYGSAAGNSVLFNDQDEVWYLEIVTGHHYVAQRIPDDAYVITANQVAIQHVDFNDPDNFIWSDGIQEFVAENHLNPDQEGFNFRHIFGTSNEKDRHYNTPRVWYGQRYFNPEIIQDPESNDLPFICRTNKKISVDDIEYILGSHYQETKFDPLGKGSDEDKLRYRPIGLNRTQNSHVLQIRNDVPESYQSIMWLAMSYPTFAPYVPFFANMNDTAPSYNNTSMTYNFGDAYWLYKSLGALVEGHYSQLVQMDLDYLIDARKYFHARVHEIDQLANSYQGDDLTGYLTDLNQETVQNIENKTHKLMGDLFIKGAELSKLTFNMDKNL